MDQATERLERAIATETTVGAIAKVARLSNSATLRHLKARGKVSNLNKPRTIKEVA